MIIYHFFSNIIFNRYVFKYYIIKKNGQLKVMVNFSKEINNENKTNVKEITKQAVKTIKVFYNTLNNKDICVCKFLYISSPKLAIFPIIIPSVLKIIFFSLVFLGATRSLIVKFSVLPFVEEYLLIFYSFYLN